MTVNELQVKARPIQLEPWQLRKLGIIEERIDLPGPFRLGIEDILIRRATSKQDLELCCVGMHNERHERANSILYPAPTTHQGPPRTCNGRDSGMPTPSNPQADRRCLSGEQHLQTL